jgi:hypothetical protein
MAISEVNLSEPVAILFDEVIDRLEMFEACARQASAFIQEREFGNAIVTLDELWDVDGAWEKAMRQVQELEEAVERELGEGWQGECPHCGDIHAADGTPDEHGNRFVEELGVCSNCADDAGEVDDGN